jgi:transposase
MGFNIAQIETDLKVFRKNDEVRRKLFILYEWAENQSQKRTALKYGVHPRTLNRWKMKYESHGSEGLFTKAKSGRPRKDWIRGRLAKRIIKLRKKYQWGAEVICAHLKKWDDIEVSQYRVFELLKSKKLIKKIRRKKVKNKHTKVVEIEIPGAHTQMDVRHLDGRNDKNKRYVYNFVDHASKWSYKRVYDSYGNYHTEDFIKRILKICPFIITRLQCDNGAEFTNKFRGGREHILEKICRENNINFRLIPPGEKELQGLVEGHHRIDKDEFFERKGKMKVGPLNDSLEDHLEFKNSMRGYKSNNWKSPNEYIWDFTVLTIAKYNLKLEDLYTDESIEVLKAA